MKANIKKLINRIPINVKLLFQFYLLSITLFFVFRLILFFTQLEQVGEASTGKILQAFLMGVRFDVVISGYILLLPAVVWSVFTFIGEKVVIMEKIVLIFQTILFSLCFLVCGADIPYFNQFFDRFNLCAFNWMDGNTSIILILKMIFQEPSYWLYIIPVLIASFLYYFIGNKIIKNTKTWESKHYFAKSIFTILLLALMMLGIRGRITVKSPIRVGTAYFCDNAFLCQLGLNPVFTLGRSFLDSQSSDNVEYPFMDDSTSIQNMQKELNIISVNKDYPLARSIVSDSAQNNYNVVIVIMESMSVDKMARFGCTNNLTPFLDSLSHEGLFFENCFSSGTHTYNGVYSTLFSYPTIFRQHPLKRNPILSYNGVATILKNHNYNTAFFLTHDAEFDNLNGTLRANDFDKIISQSDYPSHELKGTWGVPDDYMFRFSIPVLNEMAKSSKPFFATLLTTSDHGPFYVPPYFKPRSKDIEYQIVEYADYSLRKFMQMAKQQPWFENTIFVFVADHGSVHNAVYSLPISYIHIPLLFYCPKLLPASTCQELAGQIDLFPTLMGLLNISYTNNTFGIDLQNNKRNYTVSTGDDKFAVIDADWMLLINYADNNPIKLFKYKTKDTKDYSIEFVDKVKEMKSFGESQLQATQCILRTNKQKIRE